MAQQPAAGTIKQSLFSRIKDFFQEVKTEFNKVTWPTKEELKSSTSVVVVLLLIVAGIIWVYDFIFQLFVIGLIKVI